MRCNHKKCPLLDVSLIPLSKGKMAVIDSMYYEWLSNWSWSAVEKSNTFYAKRNQSTKPYTTRMHRQILSAPKGVEVDHKNGDGLDNRRCNLRMCTHSQNLMNMRKPQSNTSGYKGVGWHKGSCVWHAAIKYRKKRIHLGSFKDPVKAAIVYDKAAIKYFGEYANTNFPKQSYLAGQL